MGKMFKFAQLKHEGAIAKKVEENLFERPMKSLLLGQ